jgi:hypothetical protein
MYIIYVILNKEHKVDRFQIQLFNTFLYWGNMFNKKIVILIYSNDNYCTMEKAYTLIIALMLSGNIFSQNLSAYHDFRDRFYIFDNGKSVFAEPLPVQSFKVGNKSVVYVDNTGSFKVYQNGNIVKLSQSVNKYDITNNYLVYDLYNSLKVFDNGKITLLSINYSRYSAGDSIVAFYDNTKKLFKAYYSGNLLTLEDAIAKDPVHNFKVGDNIVAFLSNNNYLKVFFRGELSDLTLAETPMYYKVGRNIVAFVNKYYNSFDVFYKGEIINLSSDFPESYYTADNIVCWVDYSGAFKIFDNGEVSIISSFPPEEYFVDDKIVIYQENNFFKAYYNSKNYILENFIPVKYKIDLDKVIYLDKQNRLKIFENGEVKIVSYEKINIIDINNNVINYNVGVNATKIYYNGTIY